MNDTNAFGYQDNLGAQLGPERVPMGPNSMAQYKFSPEERRVLLECNKESFYQRSLPFSTIFGFGTFAAVQGGYLRPNPRFGAFPKVSLAVMVGYFVGKLSYQQACAEKLMALPGSYIGQLLKDRRDGKEGSSMIPKPPGSMLGATPGDVYSDAGPGSALNLDTDRPSSSTVFSEDTSRPDNEDPHSYSPEPVVPSTARSYDDMRRLNRGQAATQKQDPYRVEGPLGAAPPPPRRPARPAPPATNQYGDALE